MYFSEVKIGDEVYSILRGWGDVTYTDKKLFRITFKTGVQADYYFGGKYFESDINPEITDWRKKKREWQPKSYPNGYTIWSNGDIDSGLGALKLVKEGRIYATREQAEYAYESIRACQILNAYKAEFAPDWEADRKNSNQKKWYVYYNTGLKMWRTGLWKQIPGIVCFSKEIADQLCKDLNDGVVKL